jgi:hypothetical protein
MNPKASPKTDSDPTWQEKQRDSGSKEATKTATGMLRTATCIFSKIRIENDFSDARALSDTIDLKV